MTFEEYSEDTSGNHHEWFCSVGDKAGIIPPADLVDRCTRSHDPYYNDVALNLWDRYHSSYSTRIARAKKVLGYYHCSSSLSDTVCVLKNLVKRELSAEGS